MNRKAISPLSSTIILLVVSIIIGIIVMSWGRSYVEQATVKAEQKQVQEKQTSVFEDLDARLSSGEITKEQYDKMKAVLLQS
ncbi:TPA: SHOCT domain-containing protein [Candidatus Woesearchaeota archaeon]|nr:SHOCT domain-containing protein [Candidatus Woesearchaeota archaeon]HIH39732.1 SHOCT domain-containing protein [Candidatus Woesearchaeota archaeon]